MVFKSINVPFFLTKELLNEFAQNLLQEHPDIGWHLNDTWVPDQTPLRSAQHLQDPTDEGRRGFDKDSGAGSAGQEV